MLTTHQATVLAHLTRPNHAYAVAQEINAAGHHVIGTETCYRTVATLSKAGYIARKGTTNPPQYESTPEGETLLWETIVALRSLATYLEQTWQE
jgi:DNA-binding PadR family transcriptional regulator